MKKLGFLVWLLVGCATSPVGRGPASTESDWQSVSGKTFEFAQGHVLDHAVANGDGRDFFKDVPCGYVHVRVLFQDPQNKLTALGAPHVSGRIKMTVVGLALVGRDKAVQLTTPDGFTVFLTTSSPQSGEYSQMPTPNLRQLITCGFIKPNITNINYEETSRPSRPVGI